MKYDIEISGFGSEALGHVCLLNLKEQIYPGAEGSKGWPSWTLPVLRWTKAQGGVRRLRAFGERPADRRRGATKRLLAAARCQPRWAARRRRSGRRACCRTRSRDRHRSRRRRDEAELAASHDRADDQLPNFAMPEMNSVGAQEIFVTAAHGVCDFISAMDTDRHPRVEHVVSPAELRLARSRSAARRISRA